MAQKKSIQRQAASSSVSLKPGGAADQTSNQAAHLRAGDLCPKCRIERLDYDGLLNLSCPQCGAVDGAWGGCS